MRGALGIGVGVTFLLMLMVVSDRMTETDESYHLVCLIGALLFIGVFVGVLALTKNLP